MVKKTKTPRVDFDIPINDLNWTKKQVKLIETLQSKSNRCTFIAGPAGTSKTIVSVYAALNLLKSKRITDVSYVRTVVESGRAKLGTLPGTMDEKFEMYTAPLKEKIDELVPYKDIANRLFREERIVAIPNSFLRGRHFGPNRLVIVDECQNMTREELITAITRIGEHSQIWFLGDPKQADIGRDKSGFPEFLELFDDDESRQQGIDVFKFDKEDIMRSEFCKFVVGKLGIY